VLRRFIKTHPRAPAAAGFGLLLAGLSLWLLSPGSRPGASLAHASYDWSQRMLPQFSFSNAPVVVVYLDLDSYLREKQNPAEPWSRALHAQLLRRLTAAGARAVVFDIIFDEPGIDAAADWEFTQALRANRRVVLAAEAGRSSRAAPRVEGISTLQMALPARPFLDAAAAWGLANEQVDDDFVVRRQINGFLNLDKPGLDFATARFLGVTNAAAMGSWWIRYYGKPLAIPHVSYSAALRTDEVRDGFFRDKIVFIGARPVAGTFLERKDEFRSPLASWGDRELFMPAVEVHATQLLNLLRGDSLRRLSPGAEALTLVLAAILLAGTLFSLRPLTAAGIGVVAELCVFGFVALALTSGKIWFPWFIIGAVQIPAALAGSVLSQSLEWYRQKRRFEEQRRADELKIREQAALIEKAQDAILVEDLQGRVIYANPSAERLYGWSAAELQADGASRRMVASCEKVYAEARQTALTAGEWLGELEQTIRDGRKVTIASRCTLIKNEHGEPTSLLFINTDVTERKRLEAEFFRAQRIESIGALAGGMAHDLNNALSPILMGLQLLQKQRQDEETRRMLSVMEENTHHGADLVKQVLLFSRGRSQEREPLAIGSLVREMEHIVRQTFPKSINLAALVPGDLWPVLGNATQLHQVLLNLCVNARDAMPHGGELTLAADNIELSAGEARQIPNGAPGRFVMLIVSDTGSGIAPEILSRIFEPFFTTKPAGQGTGLGLSTLARIVAQHGGFVNVKSEAGRGTTFEIYLPGATLAPGVVTKRIQLAELPRGNGELILVVDDEQAICEMVSFGLTAQGYRVIAAANGADAIAALERQVREIRLILLDADMPVLDGKSTFPFLRALAPSTPIVLMSGQVAAKSNADAFAQLAKPFQLGELLRTVASQLSPPQVVRLEQGLAD
jgi:two-component system, cell cycle sensor histidine kinase and response regulator CckA